MILSVSIFSIIVTLQEKYYTTTKGYAKLNFFMRLKPHRITATVEETWISPATTEKHKLQAYFIMATIAWKQ